MRVRIRTKLLVAISFLILVLFSIAAYLFITEKRTELADDIYLNTLSFSRLTSDDIANFYDLYLEQNSFVYFNREIQSVFEKNPDIDLIQVVTFSGEILYDSNEDTDKKYEGPDRLVQEENFIEQIQSENISFKTLDGEVMYIKTDENGVDSYVDKNEKVMGDLESGTLIEYFVVPATERYAIYYSIDYENLNARVQRMMTRIVYLAAFGVMLGMIFSYIMSLNLTRPVGKLVRGVEGIAKGDLKTRVEVKSHDELRFLGDAFNRMAIDLEASIDAKMYQERVGKELELARDIQKNLIPDVIPQIAGLDIAADIRPAGAIGGDMYDFLPVDENKLLFYLGDVTGHGVPAGIVSSIASALFYGYSVENDLRTIMVNVNRVMKAKTMPNIFMTLCLMHWNALNNEFSYVNAGHEQVVHYKKAENKIELFPSGGIALGMLPDVSNHLHCEMATLNSGDFIVIYSDGIPEAWRTETENLGMEGFVQIVGKYANAQSAEEIKNGILADVDAYRAGFEQKDDITIIVVKKL